jgi:hypothetical protein
VYAVLVFLGILIFVENKPGETSIPELWETEDDKKLEIKQLKEKYTKYAYWLLSKKHRWFY